MNLSLPREPGQAVEAFGENNGKAAKKLWSAPYVIVGELDQAEATLGAGADGVPGTSHS